MRFAVVRMRNPDRGRWPNATVVDFPLMLDEVDVTSMREELEYIEAGRLPWWDKTFTEADFTEEECCR